LSQGLLVDLRAMFGALAGAAAPASAPNILSQGLLVDLRAMFGALAGAAGDALGGEAMAPLTEAQDKLAEMEESLGAPQETLSKLTDSIGGGLPSEPLDAANKLLSDFIGSISSALDGDTSKLLPPGAGCIASCWLGQVKSRLTAFKDEVDKLINEAKTTPDSVGKELQGMKEKMTAGSASFNGIASALEDSANSIKDSVGDMEKMKNMTETLDGLEAKFTDALTKARESLQNITNALASTPDTVVSMLQELINTIEKFKAGAPKKIVSCFKPPCCCCCLAGGASEVQDTLEQTMGTVADMLSLEPVLTALKTMQEALKGFDASPAFAILDQVQQNFGSVLGPVKEAAGKMAEMGGSLPGM